MRSTRNKAALVALFLFFGVVALSLWAIADSTSNWEKKVPAEDRGRPNPLASDAAAAGLGSKLYADKCAKCHGENGEGQGHHPSLRTASVHQATAGELQWLLTHGNRWHGMPAFGSLSETERWQLVSFIQSLPADSK